MTEYTLSVARDLHDRSRALDWLTALFPVALMALFNYHWSVVLLVLPAMAGYLAVAALLQRAGLLQAPALPALVTGLLIAFCLPAGAPLWLPGLAGVAAALTAALPELLSRRWAGRSFAQPLLQPALVGYVLVWLLFSGFLREFTMPAQWATVDAATASTALAGLWDPTRAVPLGRLFFGLYAGAVGEICSPVLLLAAAYLLLRRRLRLIAPAAMLAVIALLSWVLWGAPLYALLAGGTLLTALLLADRAVAPAHPGAQAVAGVIAGGVTVLLRVATHTDGTAVGVLVACALSPLYPVLGCWIARFSRWVWTLAKEIFIKIKKIEKNS